MNTDAYNYGNVAVLGAGESGVSVARLLAAEGSRVQVLDTAPPEALEARSSSLAELGIPLITGGRATEVPEGTTLAVLSPGIDPASDQVQSFMRAGVPLSGELETAWERCQCPVVAVTGTNGKTTTTQLIEVMFNAAGVRTQACGNIGPAFSSHVPASKSFDVMTVEVSSFQLETVRTFRPRIAVWLNFAADHLDRYASMEAYFAAKLRIFENQGVDDWAVVNARDNLPALKARKLTFDAQNPGADFGLVQETIVFRGSPVLSMAQTCLNGVHNAENLMAALATGHAWGLSWDSMKAALCAYRPLPHRCEVVGVFNGVEYVNDSKATNLDAVEKALASEKRRVVLIAGGKDKGFEFDSITSLVASRCRSAVLIGEMARRIEAQWTNSVPCRRAETLAEAVQISSREALPGDVVLFSPGTSSFDMFKSYADRGNQFRALVSNLSA